MLGSQPLLAQYLSLEFDAGLIPLNSTGLYLKPYGIGSSVEGAVHGVFHPVQAATGIWRMASPGPSGNAVDYSLSMFER